jgi:methionyl-tRNA synthetase
MALDLPLPKQVFGHGWLIINGGKISKSLGNYKDPREYIRDYGIDAVRYYALREVPFGSDGNFSEELLISRTNSDLANNYGNLVNRTISMQHKYFDGIIQENIAIEPIDEPLINDLNNLKNLVKEKMDNLRVSDAIAEIMEVLKKCNKYIDETSPWLLAKDNDKKERLGTVLYNLLDAIRICTILLKPFIVKTTTIVLEQINTQKTNFEDLEYGKLEKGIKVNNPTVIFARIEK